MRNLQNLGIRKEERAENTEYTIEDKKRSNKDLARVVKAIIDDREGKFRYRVNVPEGIRHQMDDILSVKSREVFWQSLNARYADNIAKKIIVTAGVVGGLVGLAYGYEQGSQAGIDASRTFEYVPLLPKLVHAGFGVFGTVVGTLLCGYVSVYSVGGILRAGIRAVNPLHDKGLDYDVFRAARVTVRNNKETDNDSKVSESNQLG